MRRLLVVPVLMLSLLTPPAVAAAEPPAAPATASPERAGGWHPRQELYSSTVTRRDLPIRMNDGVVLRGDLILPVGRGGKPITRVAPNGKVSRVTGGWQVLSQRKLLRSRSRYLDGRLIQPYHPFTRAAKAKLPRGKVAPIDVEIFPTGAAIRPGHRLRLSVQAFDIPHLLSPLPDLLGQLSPLTVHVSKRYPSVLTLPVR